MSSNAKTLTVLPSDCQVTKYWHRRVLTKTLILHLLTENATVTNECPFSNLFKYSFQCAGFLWMCLIMYNVSTHTMAHLMDFLNECFRIYSSTIYSLHSDDHGTQIQILKEEQKSRTNAFLTMQSWYYGPFYKMYINIS